MSDTQMRDWLRSGSDQMHVAMRESNYSKAGFESPIEDADLGYYVALHGATSQFHGTSYAQPLPTAVDDLLAQRATTLEYFQRGGDRNDEWLQAYAQQHNAITEQLEQAHQAMLQGQTPAEFSVRTHERADQPALTSDHEIAPHQQHIESAGYQQHPEHVSYTQHPDIEIAHQREHGGLTPPGHHRGLSH